MAKSFKDINKKLDSIAVCLGEQKDRIEIAALNSGMVEMIDRIFERGQALDGELMPEYSTAYLNRRINKLKVSSAKKILFWEGNLRNSIDVGQYQGRNVIGFNDKDQADIAEYQETSDIQVNKKIFGLSEEELDITHDRFNKLLAKTILDCFNNNV